MAFRNVLLLLSAGALVIGAANYFQGRKDTAHAATGGADIPIASATDAPMSTIQLKTEIWLEGLDWPWALDFSETGDALLTEKSGKLWSISDDREKTLISGTPKVLDYGQGGLLDVAYDPEYEDNGWVYLTYAHELPEGSGIAMTRLVRGKISDNQWTVQETLFEAKSEDYVKARVHFGSRITFDDEERLYFSIGDRGKKDMAQDPSKPNGKVHRINRDGSIPGDNPFIGETDYPSIYSYGNRNPQGLVFTNGQLWSTEHGPKGGDELNLIEAGINYGWPKISYGRNYSGTVLTPYTHMEGMEQPKSMWKPSIAACGLDVYDGGMFPEWQGDLLAGALRYQELRLIDLENGQYKGEEIILKGEGRVRDVTAGPDGAIYVVTENPNQILKISKE